MDALSYSTARRSLAKILNKVCQDHAPQIITRQKKDSVVIMSLEDYESLEETAHLLRAPKNARRLLESIAPLDSDEGMVEPCRIDSGLTKAAPWRTL